MTSRGRVELALVINTLHNWATDENRDTISALSEKQAKEAADYLKGAWLIIERRKR